ncbi:MAG: ACP S-malonyltransferase [Anaerolineae bacterium]
MIEWLDTALLFPGQGSQHVGMGASVAQAYPEARAVFEQADALLGESLSDLCWNGPEDALNDTFNTQPALYVTSIATLRALEAALGDSVRPAFVAGHSLGELTALTAAGALPFEEGLMLVRERGRLMRQAGETNPGAMAAVLGLDTAQVRAICELASTETGSPLVLANDNCPGQIVISGAAEALERGVTLAEEAGARRVVRLAVSIASHSPLMAPAQAAFAEAVAGVHWQAPVVPVVGNVTARPLDTIPAIQEELAAQLTSSVRWTESMQYLLGAEITRFIEIGSGDVLSGLLKRIDRKATRIAVNNAEAIESLR